MTNKFQEFKTISSLMLLGTYLRFLNLGEKSLWFDESISYFTSKINISSLINATLADNHPPLYFIFLHFWMRLYEAEWFLRLPSVFFGIVSIPLMYSFARKIVSKQVATLATLIFTLAPLHLYYSQEARNYSFWIMLVLIILNYYLIFIKNINLKNAIIFTFITTVSFYTHYFTLLLLLPICLSILMVCSKRQASQNLGTLAVASMLLLTIPGILLYFFFEHPKPWHLDQAQMVISTFPYLFFGGIGNYSLKSLVLQSSPWYLRLSIIFLTLILLFLSSLGILKSEKLKHHSFLLYLTFIPPITLLLLSVFDSIFLSPKAVIFTSIPLYIFVAYGFSVLSKSRQNVILFLSLFFYLAIITHYYAHPLFLGPPLREFATSLQEKNSNGNTIAHTSMFTYYPFRYYFQDEDINYLVIDSELSTITKHEIGGFEEDIEELEKSSNQIWLINMEHFSPPHKVAALKTQINQRHSLNQILKQGSFELYTYYPADQSK